MRSTSPTSRGEMISHITPLIMSPQPSSLSYFNAACPPQKNTSCLCKSLWILLIMDHIFTHRISLLSRFQGSRGKNEDWDCTIVVLTTGCKVSTHLGIYALDFDYPESDPGGQQKACPNIRQHSSVSPEGSNLCSLEPLEVFCGVFHQLKEPQEELSRK